MYELSEHLLDKSFYINYMIAVGFLLLFYLFLFLLPIYIFFPKYSLILVGILEISLIISGYFWVKVLKKLYLTFNIVLFNIAKIFMLVGFVIIPSISLVFTLLTYLFQSLYLIFLFLVIVFIFITYLFSLIAFSLSAFSFYLVDIRKFISETEY
jgi:hypothetical protein